MVEACRSLLELRDRVAFRFPLLFEDDRLEVAVEGRNKAVSVPICRVLGSA